MDGAKRDVDVAIVGAGPVGLVLGIQLAQRPDFYLHGAAHDLSSATSLIRDLRSRLDTNHQPRSKELHKQGEFS